MATSFALLIALGLVLATIAIHYETLRATADFISQLRTPPRARIPIVIVGVLVAHVLEICLYAATFAAMQHWLGFGRIERPARGQCVRLSLFFDVELHDVRRRRRVCGRATPLVAAVEALNGLVPIAWSASFTYLAMERFWMAHHGGARRRPLVWRGE